MNDNHFRTDPSFDALFPKEIQKHSFIHWTPVEIFETALEWLELNAVSQLLDIGSGSGKFCALAGMRSKGAVTGVEFRPDLVKVAKKTAKKLKLSNVSFINADVTTIDFTAFTHFYYYNPFCEFLAEFDHIDDSISFDREAFRKYEDYVIHQYELLPIGTKVVTYCSESFTFPSSYELKNLLYDGKLALWVKTI
jgi:cyclopropane fatty-acyl-phospholipid synthase-like methyltransferase